MRTKFQLILQDMGEGGKVGEKLFRRADTDDVQADIIRARVAASIPVKAGQRVPRKATASAVRTGATTSAMVRTGPESDCR